MGLVDPAASTDAGVIAIFGSTGTGKTKLSVEIARAIGADGGQRYGGYAGAEVISCDSMQIYKGLDIITNKATEGEMQGVVHHLIGFVDPEGEAEGGSYDVTRFVADTNRIARELRGEGKVPIVCGGTTYYLQHLLFPGRLISSQPSTEEAREDAVDLSADPVYQRLQAEQRELLQQVSVGSSAKLDLAAKATADPTLAMQLWQLLEQVDPVMAARWHYRDARKVANSLRVYKETGRPHSHWIAQQDLQHTLSTPPRSSHDAADAGVSSSRKLLFWLWCDPPVLRKRLDDRVDEMVQRGLEAEVREMRTIAKSMLDDVVERTNSYQTGIFQTIGYRQFAEYLDRLEALSSSSQEEERAQWFGKAVQDTKTATRQYAKSQLKWVQNKLVPEVRRAQAVLAQSGQVELYLLDATDVSVWDDKVLTPALDVVSRFLCSNPLPHPTTISNPTAAAQYLYSGRTPNQALSKLGCAAAGDDAGAGEGARTIQANMLYTCPVCSFDPAHPVRIRSVDKAAHEKGRHHRNNVKRNMSPHEKEQRIRDKIEIGRALKALRDRLKGREHSAGDGEKNVA